MSTPISHIKSEKHCVYTTLPYQIRKRLCLHHSPISNQKKIVSTPLSHIKSEKDCVYTTLPYQTRKTLCLHHSPISNQKNIVSTPLSHIKPEKHCVHITLTYQIRKIFRLSHSHTLKEKNISSTPLSQIKSVKYFVCWYHIHHWYLKWNDQGSDQRSPLWSGGVCVCVWGGEGKKVTIDCQTNVKTNTVYYY